MNDWYDNKGIFLDTFLRYFLNSKFCIITFITTSQNILFIQHARTVGGWSTLELSVSVD